ncbi:hypothetical protein SAFG77S_06674 [Streptomyces afghaniensis]
MPAGRPVPSTERPGQQRASAPVWGGPSDHRPDHGAASGEFRSSLSACVNVVGLRVRQPAPAELVRPAVADPGTLRIPDEIDLHARVDIAAAVVADRRPPAVEYRVVVLAGDDRAVEPRLRCGARAGRCRRLRSGGRAGPERDQDGQQHQLMPSTSSPTSLVTCFAHMDAWSASADDSTQPSTVAWRGAHLSA